MRWLSTTTMGMRLTVVGVIVIVLIAAVLILTVLSPRVALSVDGAAPGLESTPPPRWVVPADLPPSAETPSRPGVSGLVDAAWVAAVAAQSGIPERALAAYAGAAIAKHAERPDCALGWNTLAGIGWVESRHGSYGGASIAADGTVSPSIIGIALDGATTALIADTDDGAIDGDTEFDRAVGPLQFIPGCWANWYIDASGDGLADPHNIDDAALAAANYLCRAVPTLGDEASWRAGIAAYNADGAYLDAVASAALRYAEAAGPSMTSR